MRALILELVVFTALLTVGLIYMADIFISIQEANIYETVRDIQSVNTGGLGW